MALPRINRQTDPWRAFQQRATEGIADWLSQLPGEAEAWIASPSDRLGASDRLHAFVRGRVTINPVTREPLAPVQIHLLELVLEAVDWQALARFDGQPTEERLGSASSTQLGLPGRHGRADSEPFSVSSFQGGT